MNRRLLDLHYLYRKLPTLECKGLCWDSCGLVVASPIESKVLGGSSTHRALGTVEGGYCEHLKDGRCTVYEKRPMICRLWGMTEAMKCPHGCIPSRWVSDEEATQLYAALNRI